MALSRLISGSLGRALVLAGLAVLLTGCAVGSAAPVATTAAPQPSYRIVNGTRYVPVGTAEQEYRAEAETLRLPSTQVWQAHPLAATDQGSPVWYQAGFGRQTADRYWFCRWAAVAAAAASPAVRSNAVTTLQQMLHLYYYTTALDVPSRPQLVRELTSARHGDLRELRNDLRLNC
jgi:hypothetical protein